MRLTELGNSMTYVNIVLSDKGWIKLDIACAQGKKLHDKRHDMKEKDDRREMDRALKKF